MYPPYGYGYPPTYGYTSPYYAQPQWGQPQFAGQTQFGVQSSVPLGNFPQGTNQALTPGTFGSQGTLLPPTRLLNPQWAMPPAASPPPYTFEDIFTYPGLPDLTIPVNSPIASIAQLGNLRANSGSIFDVLALAGQPTPLIEREANRMPPLFTLPDFGLVEYA